MIGEEQGKWSKSKKRDRYHGAREYKGSLGHLYYRAAYLDGSSPVI